MKKGISMPMIAIILGFVFIMIVLITWFTFQEDTKKLFEEGPFKPVKPDTTYTTGTSAGKSGIADSGQRDVTKCTPLFELKGTADQNAAEIATRAYACFKEAVVNRKVVHFCGCVVSVNHDIPRKLIEKHLGNYPKLSKGGFISYEQDPVEALIDSWEEGYESRKPLLEKGWKYRICADADELDPDDDDLMITGRDDCSAI